MSKGNGGGGKQGAGEQSSSMADLEKEFRAAIGQFQAGRLDEAEGILAGIRRVQPRIPDVLHLSGVIALREGRAKDAVRHLRQAMSATPGSAELHNLLGSAQRRDGQTKAALKSLKKAVSLDPDLAQAHYNLGNALKDMGRLNDAIVRFSRAVDLEPGLADAHFNLGLALKEAGDLDRAEAAYRRALEITPQDPEVLNNLGTVLRERGRLDDAVENFRRALSLKPAYAEAQYNLGNALGLSDKLSEAAESYGRAVSLHPDYLEAHNNLGDVFQKMGRYEEAAASYGRALALDPKSVPVHCHLGSALRGLGRNDEAIDYFRRALSLDPDYTAALFSLGDALESVNELTQAHEVIDHGLAVAPDDIGINLVAARLDRRAGNIEKGLARLSGLEPDSDTPAALRSQRLIELGQLHERAKDAEAAFPCFAEGNRLSAETWEARNTDKTRFTRFIDRYQNRFTEDWVGTWTPAPPGDGSPPVFLIGFPRSGTTLLDQIMDSHPDLHVVEEKQILDDVRRQLIAASDDYPANLAGLSADEIRGFRETYFARARSFVPDSEGGILIDKLPLNTVEAGLIHRIFPDAKFIFALRHPCDVCLSCFMQAFSINDAMANFFTIEDTSALYVKVMTLWQRYERLLPLSVHRIRYEDLVEDFETQVRGLLDFLGVGWDDAVYDYAANAARRKRINTPSYNQVTEKIYKRARFRWRRYRKNLAPIIDQLMPFVQYFGYGDPAEAEDRPDG